MVAPSNSTRRLHFEEFELDLDSCELHTNGRRVDLQGQPFQILVALLERNGELVTREDLKAKLWPSDTFVDFDHSLNRAVNRLREALRDSAEHPRFIETLPRRGYRFIAPVEDRARDSDGAKPNIQVDVGLSVAHPTVPPTTEVRQTRDVAARDTPGALPGSSIHSVLSRSQFLVFAGVIAVAILGMYMARVGKGGLNFREIQINKLTENGSVADMAISPDGRFVVYAQRDGERQSLRLHQVMTGSDVQIMPSGPEFHGLTFSPDTNYVYFVRSDPNDPFFKYLYSVPLLGGPTRQLISDVDSPVSFSPRGQQFAYERGVASRNVVELRTANADGSGDRVLATIQNADVGLFQPGPNWSRDGQTIVASFRLLRKQKEWALACVFVSNGRVREIYASAAPMGRPVWLRTGDGLLMPHYDPTYRRTQLWMVSYPSGVAGRFTNDLTDYEPQLDITHDGRTVAAIASTWISNIWAASAVDLSNPHQITSSELPLLDIAEVADGKLVSTSGDGRLWLMNSDGSQREPFGDIHEAGWLTPCGHFLIFALYENSQITLTRMNLDGSHPTKLVSGDLYAPACSPDGKFVFFVNGHQPQKIWRMSTDGGTSVEIAAGMGDGITGRLDISPDGSLLAYPFDEYPPAWKIAVIPISGGPLIKTFRVPGGIEGLRWSRDGKSLRYLLTQNGATNIWEQPLAGLEPKQLTHFASGRIFDFSWSTDNANLFLARGNINSDVILFRNLP